MSVPWSVRKLDSNLKEVKISIEILTIVMNDLKTVASNNQLLNSILKTVRM